MKIALIGQKGIPAKNGGVDRHVESLAFFLAKNKNLEVISYNRRAYLSPGLKEWEGVKIISLAFIQSKHLAAISHGFLATIDALIKKVDIIHYHGIGPCLLAWLPKLLRPKTKIIATLHSFDYGNEKWGTFAKFMLKLGEKMMTKYADEVIVLTSLMRDYLYQRHGRDSVIIPNGALVKEANDFGVLEKLGLEKNKYIISVSRLIKLKGIQYLIKVFKKLKSENSITSDMKLLIVGDGEYSDELKNLAGDYKDIIFSGNQSGANLAALYAGANLFVQSSEMEGLSISILEAMAYGLPILASDISANREAGADTVYYFQVKNEDDLALKLTNVLRKTDETKDMGRKAKERVEKVFNWEIISQEIFKLYENSLRKF
ncbi:glycosyltransferase family 4 protein [Patescibacteria group bacterium]|nr:glycosyltransferase family 4 protein [Patescibacteria group bacterium]